jgi:hypothetical protein
MTDPRGRRCSTADGCSAVRAGTVSGRVMMPARFTLDGHETATGTQWFDRFALRWPRVGGDAGRRIFDRLQSVSSPVADRMRTHLSGSLEGVAVAVFEAVRDDAVELTVIRQILIDAVGNVWLLLGVPRGRARRVDGPSHRTDRNTTRLLCVGVRDRWSLVTRTRTVWRRTSAHRWHESM